MKCKWKKRSLMFERWRPIKHFTANFRDKHMSTHEWEEWTDENSGRQYWIFFSVESIVHLAHVDATDHKALLMQQPGRSLIECMSYNMNVILFVWAPLAAANEPRVCVFVGRRKITWQIIQNTMPSTVIHNIIMYWMVYIVYLIPWCVAITNCAPHNNDWFIWPIGFSCYYSLLFFPFFLLSSFYIWIVWQIAPNITIWPDDCGRIASPRLVRSDEDELMSHAITTSIHITIYNIYFEKPFGNIILYFFTYARWVCVCETEINATRDKDTSNEWKKFVADAAKRIYWTANWFCIQYAPETTDDCFVYSFRNLDRFEWLWWMNLSAQLISIQCILGFSRFSRRILFKQPYSYMIHVDSDGESLIVYINAYYSGMCVCGVRCNIICAWCEISWRNHRWKLKTHIWNRFLWLSCGECSWVEPFWTSSDNRQQSW